MRDGLRRLIVSGTLPLGEKLPSVRELSTQLTINPNTIQRAYRELETEGYLCSVAGRGSYVCAQIPDDPARQSPCCSSSTRPCRSCCTSACAVRSCAAAFPKEERTMIEVKDVVKTFDGFRALDGVTMTVPRGAVYGLVGPNGAGKSTLIRHLTGIYRPDSGAIDIDGQPVYENPAVKARIAYIPDDVFYFPQATIPDMMRYYRGIYPKFDAERYQKLGEVFQLDPKRQIRRLSKGMQKQAAFWLAMSLRPDVLILDEPVDGLDPVMRRQVWNLVLADVAENGTTVLISSHNLRELEDVCDHVGIMNGGKVLLEHPLTELQANIVKVLVALPDEAKLPDGLDILHQSSQGHLYTLIVHGDAAEVTNRLSTAQPQYLDVVPLTLEEIFIYELGGADYAVKDILL